MPREISRSDQYPTWIGLVFVFNLIVGTGALTLPAVFAKAGWLLGLIIIIILAFISYITLTFIIETMACANAILHWKLVHILKQDKNINDTGSDINHSLLESDDNDNLSDTTIEEAPLFSQNSRYYVLDRKVELGEMASLFFNNTGRVLFYLCLSIYLYGDLSIYSTAVAKSLRDVLCQRLTNDSMSDDNIHELPCRDDMTLTRFDCYRISLCIFAGLLSPFAFFNVSKTKYIQIITISFRWLAFSIMINIALYRLITDGAQGNPPMAKLSGVPALFGACIYSFMCHHSLPSLIAPLHNKSQLKSLFCLDYIIICGFYLFLAFTGAFAFDKLNDLYTLNFAPSDSQSSIILELIDYFLALFPVFTLSTTFPIIAITLRNNLQALFLDSSRLQSYNFLVRRILFPVLAIAPPIVISFYTDNVKNLVGFTGSYGGTGIQYIIPITLVYYARRSCLSLLGRGITNEYSSPFRSPLWLVFVFLWSITCLVFVTVNFF